MIAVWKLDIIQEDEKWLICLSGPSPKPFKYEIPDKDANSLLSGINHTLTEKSHKREIERKFRLKYIPDLSGIEKLKIEQGYLLDDEWVVRIRIMNEESFITLKGGVKDGLGCDEFEYDIPKSDAEFMIANAPLGKVYKDRYVIHFGSHDWDMDLFRKNLKYLDLAEIELDSETETFEMPDWVGEEVTGQKTYFNKNLAKLEKWEGSKTPIGTGSEW